MSNILKLITAIAIPLVIGFGGSLFTTTGPGSWYETINKPPWNPPNGIFGPVWTALYILMGIALFLVWQKEKPGKVKQTSILFFSIQLILNFFWSVIFFGEHQIGLAFFEIILLWLMIIFTIFMFARLSKPAAWLMVPYISWVSFAAILNYTIWQLN